MNRILLGVSLLLVSCAFSSKMNSSGGYGSSAPAPAAAAPPSLQPSGQEPAYWLQLSSDDSTSMASAQIAKQNTDQYGASLLRHEFLNYYDPPAALFGDEGWPVQGTLSEGIDFGAKLVVHEATADAGMTGELLLQLRAAPVAPQTRRPWHLVYCVDVSGSMEGEKMDFTKQALKRSLQHLKAGDRVSLVTFSDNSTTVLAFEAYPSPRITAAFDALKATNSTNMIAGLNDAYAIAQQHQSAELLSRVLVFGDGDANVGDTDVARFAALTRHGNEEGIYLSSVGVGYGFDWDRMNRLSDAGKGASIFLPNAGEVETMFGRDFYKLVEVAADDVAVELTLPESMQLLDFSGEETSTDPNARVPSVILASGDDLTILARFSLTESSLDQQLKLTLKARPLGLGEVATHVEDGLTVEDFTGAPGALYARTRLVDAYARFASTTGADKTQLVSDLAAYPSADPGLDEIRALLAR